VALEEILVSLALLADVEDKESRVTLDCLVCKGRLARMERWVLLVPRDRLESLVSTDVMALLDLSDLSVFLEGEVILVPLELLALKEQLEELVLPALLDLLAHLAETVLLGLVVNVDLKVTPDRSSQRL